MTEKRGNFWRILAIFTLLILNAGAVSLFYYSKAEIKSFTDSFKLASQNSARWSGLTASADVTLPKEDVFGEDLAGIARFPGSTRTSYQKNDLSSVVEYQALDKPEKVLLYFKSLLAKDNWVLKETSPVQIQFVKADQSVLIKVAQENGLTIYTITK